MRSSAVQENQMEDSWPSNKDKNCINVKPVEQLLTADCNGSFETDACDEFLRPPDILPRIGDEFQVEIPPLTKKFDYNFLVGLSVPCFSQKHAMPSKSSAKNENFPNRKKFETIYWVPGLCTEQWSDAEKASFLLGLYIFQKDFVEVRRFVETKEMGAILSFYYGEFYGSDVYYKWSGGRKKKSKKCVYGQGIFSGLRQQELLSRLRTRISEHLHDALLEVLKRFSDEKTSLAECVSSLKSMVGTSILVESIGIGTGKRDLTGMALEPLRSNKTVTVRPEIPTGKACSKLTTSEIIKFLSGNYRLSKNRSNDLFWEAVWPRLLARGWHSEQPKNQAFQNGLVFLMPGVKKFSRRKLLRGDHYFDSVSDILNKVGREPDLIELNEEDDGRKKVEVLTNERESEKDDDDSPARKRRPYLQPRTSNLDSDIISFMVVDTSLRGGKIRELRSRPNEVLRSLTSQDRTKDGYEVEMDESETRKRSGEKTKSNEGMKSEKGSHKEKQLKKFPSKKMKRANEHHVAPPIKKKTRKTKPVPGSENGVSSCTSSIRELPKNLVSRTGSYQEKTSSASSSKGSPDESVECALIDLNIPQMPPELENTFITTESSKGQESKTNSSTIEAKTEQEPNVNPRRHSTRTREPTMRALEAVADGYVAVNRKRKSKDGETIHRPSQHVRGGTRPAESTNSMASHQTEEAENVSKSNEFSDFQEANEDSVLGQKLTNEPNLFR